MIQNLKYYKQDFNLYKNRIILTLTKKKLKHKKHDLTTIRWKLQFQYNLFTI